MPEHWTPLVLLAVGSQLIGQGLMVYAIGHLSPVVVGIGLLTQPAIAATIGWLAYDERLDAIDLIGMIAIGLAVVLARAGER
jgi:drug/metabolite transporter (DMT)-like permease